MSSAQFSSNTIITDELISAFIKARKEIYWGVQMVSQATQIISEHDSSAGAILEYRREQGAFLGNYLQFNQRLGLDVASFALQLFGEDGDVISRFPLKNKNLYLALQWISFQVEPLLDDEVPELSINTKYELFYPFEKGSKFTMPSKIEIKAYTDLYNYASGFLQSFSHDFEIASPFFTEPHNLQSQIAKVLTINAKGHVNTACYCGFSPGDAAFDGPYFFVKREHGFKVDMGLLPPQPKNTFWQSKSWFGLVLPVNRINLMSSNATQNEVLTWFFQKAIHLLSSL